MPSPRRLKLVTVAIVTLLVVVLYYNSRSTTKPQHERYMDTLRQYGVKDKQEMEDAAQMAQRLRDAEAGAKERANIKSPGPPPKAEKEEEVAVKGEDKEEKAQESMDELLGTILKRSPVIIFSKSYCPYSMKAKRILLEGYSISPAPHVVELDRIPQGAELQAFLGQRTGRRTVPNVMVNGKSIGGGDDVQALDQSNQLADTLKKMGGKRLSVEKKS